MKISKLIFKIIVNSDNNNNNYTKIMVEVVKNHYFLRVAIILFSILQIPLCRIVTTMDQKLLYLQAEEEEELAER